MRHANKFLFGSGLALALASASGGCSTKAPEGFAASAPALPVGTVPASAGTHQDLGIAEWRIYMGKAHSVLSGYDDAGNPVLGLALTAVAGTPKSLAYLRLNLLDGTSTTLIHVANGMDRGALSKAQALLVGHALADMVASGQVHGKKRPKSAGGSGLHILGAGDPTDPCTQAASDNAVTVQEGAIGCLSSGLSKSAIDAILAAGGSALNLPGPPDCVDMSKGALAYAAACNPSAPGQEGCMTDPNSGACIPGTAGFWCGPDSPGGVQAATCPDGGTGDDAGTGQVDQNQQTGALDAVANNQSCPSCPAGSTDIAPSGNGDVNATSGGDGGAAGGAGGGGGSSDDGGGGGGASGDDGGGYCGNDGNPCNSDADCCNSGCNGGTCGGASAVDGGAAGGGCSNDGVACGSSSECCNADCYGGSCGGSADDGGSTCAAEGATCSMNSECCDADCFGGICGGDGGATCAADGTSCAINSDCCNIDCNNNVCGGVYADGGVPCAHDGSSCSANGDCCSDNCSSGTCGAAAACGSSGATCAADTDCCSGLTCQGGVCAAPATCAQQGEACGSGCCNNDCGSCDNTCGGANSQTCDDGVACCPPSSCQDDGSGNGTTACL